MTARSIPDSALPRLVAEYEAGYTAAELGVEYGCSATAVTNALRRSGFPIRAAAPRLRQLPPAQQAEVRRRWESGESVHGIRTALGVNARMVRRALGMKDSVDELRYARPNGPLHASWKGGRRSQGKYASLWVAPDDALASMRNCEGYVPEHRVVMARALGRPLEPHETVHHIDGQTQHNVLSNLQLRLGKHGKGVVMRCNACGSHDIKATRIADVNSTTTSAP